MRIIKGFSVLLASVGLVVLGGALEGLHLATFNHPLSLLAVLVLFALFAVTQYALAEIVASIQFALGIGEHAPTQRLKAQKLFSSFGRNAILSGFATAFIGILQAFSNAEQTEKIGSGIAVAVMAVYFGFSLNAFLCIPLEVAAIERMNPKKNQRRQTQGALWALVALVGSSCALYGVSFILEANAFRGIVGNLLILLSAPLATCAFFTSNGDLANRLFAMRRSLVSSCVLSVTIGFIHTMGNLAEWGTMFKGVGVALSPILYAILLGLIATLFAERLSRQQGKKIYPMHLSLKREGAMAAGSLFMLASLLVATITFLGHDDRKHFENASSDVMCNLPGPQLASTDNAGDRALIAKRIEEREAFCQARRHLK